MKNTVTLIATLAACLSSYAQHMHDMPSETEDVVAATSNYVEKVRARVAASNTNEIPVRSGLSVPSFVMSNTNAMQELDRLLKDSHWFSLCQGIYLKALPESSAASLSFYKERKPHYVKAVINGMGALSKNERAAYVVERFAPYSPKTVGWFREALGKEAARLIVPALRRKGMAVTTGPDGRSPTKEYANRISDALNAPMFDGLNDILDDLGVPARVDLAQFGITSEEDARNTASGIMSGDIDPTPAKMADLSIALGTEEFNKFIESYNGGRR